jgi:hypothetical protein
MKKLSEKEIIRLMREEWIKKVNGLLSEKAEKNSDNLKMLARVNGKEKFRHPNNSQFTTLPINELIILKIIY